MIAPRALLFSVSALIQQLRLLQRRTPTFARLVNLICRFDQLSQPVQKGMPSDYLVVRRTTISMHFHQPDLSKPEQLSLHRGRPGAYASAQLPYPDSPPVRKDQDPE